MGCAPSLGTPLLGAASDEAVDARTFSFLLAQAVSARKKEEEEEDGEQLKAKHQLTKVDKWEIEREKAAEEHMAGRGESAAAASGRARRVAREPRWQLLLVLHREKEEAEEEEEEEDETVAPLLLLRCLLVLPSSSASWVMVFGVRGLASPHPILGATAWVSCLRLAHDVTMLEFFNVPSMYEAILAILSCLLRGTR